MCMFQRSVYKERYRSVNMRLHTKFFLPGCNKILVPSLMVKRSEYPGSEVCLGRRVLIIFGRVLCLGENSKPYVLIPGTKSITLFMAVIRKQERLTILIW